MDHVYVRNISWFTVIIRECTSIETDIFKHIKIIIYKVFVCQNGSIQPEMLTFTTLSTTYVVPTLMTMTADRDICCFYCRYFEVIESQSLKFGMPQNLSLMYSKEDQGI
jgi:hypothetical protein